MQFKICFKKKLFLIFLILIFNSSKLNSVENKIVLKVENEIFTSLDIENEIKYLTALNPNIRKLKEDKINLIGKNSLLREKIKKIEIRKYTQTVLLDEKYLNQLIKTRYLNLNIDSKSEFLKHLKEFDVDINVIEEKISIEGLWNQLIYSKFFSKIKIDKKKLENKIKNNNSKNLKSYFLSEIVFSVSKNKNIEKEIDLINQTIVKNGFENAALIHSKSDNSQLGGKLGWIKEDSLNKKIRENLKNLEINDITKPIFTPNGYLILKIDDIKFTQKEYNLEKELQNLITFETNQQLNQYSNNYFKKIKKNLSINEL